MDAKVEIKTKDYVLDAQVGYLLRLASQRHAGIFQDTMVADLTPTQFSALMRLDEHGEVSQNQLGRLAAMDAATIKGVVDRLRAKGFVTTRADPVDKRRSLISLSDAGKNIVPQLHRIGATISDKTLSALPAKDRDTLLNLLRKLC